MDPGSPLNSDSTDIFVSASRSGEVYFYSARTGVPGIFTSTQSGAGWTDPVRVDLGTAAAGAGNPMITPDGRVLLVTMRQPGTGADIMYACRREGAWTEPRPLLPPVNSPQSDFAPAVDVSGSTLYFTSERPGIVGAQPDSIRPPSDLYRIPMRETGIDCP